MSSNLFRSVAGSLLEWSSRLLDETLSAETLQQFIVDSLTRLTEEYQRHPSDWSGRMLSELSQSQVNAAELGIGFAVTVPSERHWTTFLPSREPAIHRFQERSKQGLLQGGRIQPDTGAVLTAMLLLEPPAVEADLASSMEQLLRHVEIRRKDSLQTRSSGTDGDRLLIRHDVALCFLTAARKWGDLRFLNSALKLNDWAFSSYHGRSNVTSLTRYLLSVTECELALKEVQQG